MKLLLEETNDPLERALLEAGHAEAPSDAARRRAMTALGLSAAASIPPVAAVAAKGSKALFVKIALLSSALALSTFVLLRPRRVAPPPSEPKVEAQVAAPAASPIEIAPAPSIAPPIEEKKPVAAKPSAKPSLAEEVALLDEARKKLASGNASGALEALDRHRRTFPKGVLGDEATVLRIEALVARGDREGARKIAKTYLASHPHSPHAKRIHTLIGE